MLLRERTQDYKNYKKQVEEFYKYMDRVRSWITQAAKDLGLDTEHSFGPQHFTFAVRCLKEENKKLKQECEELKKELKNAYWLRDCEQKRNLKLEKTLKKEILKQYQYRKAFEEIEEEAKWVINDRECYDLRDADRCERILNIINKAKNCE